MKALLALTAVGLTVLALMMVLLPQDPEAARRELSSVALEPSPEMRVNGGHLTLPCFRCHEYSERNHRFPHEKHQEMGMKHCSICHIVKGHREMELVTTACHLCHNPVPDVGQKG